MNEVGLPEVIAMSVEIAQLIEVGREIMKIEKSYSAH
jgi:hypothetical protein